MKSGQLYHCLFKQVKKQIESILPFAVPLWSYMYLALQWRSHHIKHFFFFIIIQIQRVSGVRSYGEHIQLHSLPHYGWEQEVMPICMHPAKPLFQVHQEGSWHAIHASCGWGTWLLGVHGLLGTPVNPQLIVDRDSCFSCRERKVKKQYMQAS